MPSKLKLNLEVAQLRVESFEPQAAEAGPRGTVHGQAVTRFCTMYDATCNGYGTCNIYPCRPIP
jgi:hypothetical protein